MSTALFIPLPRNWPRLVKTALLHAIGLEQLALLQVRAGFENSSDPRAALVAAMDRLRERVALLEEEIGIKDARLKTIPARKRPHYPPAERLAILMLRARAGWSTAETARRFGLAPQTIAAWMKRLDDEGPEALVKTPEPVNRFPDAVTALVKKLHAAAPSLGRRKKAELLARAGVVLGASTIKRMLQRPIRPPIKPEPSKQRKLTAESAVMDAETKPRRVVSARYPHHVWHIDITRMPCGFGWWVPWWPFALIARWVLCWHIAFVQDHYSRALLAFEIFRKEPTAVEMCAFLDRAVAQAGRAPRHIVSDRGSQFQGDYLDWCKRHGARPRFGAVGKKGSIAIIERLIKSVKYEYLKTILVPLSPARMRAAVAAYARWYNTARPHSALGGATPAERLEGKTAAKPRIEPRAPYPLARGARRVRGKLELQVSYVEGRAELPMIELREAA